MKKTLAVVLALAMVLCMIPAAFADTVKTISDKSYSISADSVGAMANGANPAHAETTKANSLTLEYNYEDEQADITGKFTEDKKMALVNVGPFDENITVDYDVTIDGKKLEVNEKAGYVVGYNPENKYVTFPVELTKAGYSDTFLITVKGKAAANSDEVITETAKISLKLVNKAEYKTAKTATIAAIESTDTKKMDAYIVGSKIYLDFVGSAEFMTEGVKITFKDENGAAFKVVTWAEQTTCKNNDKGVINLGAEAKLDDSAIKYNLATDLHKNDDYCKEVVFKLETAAAKYETKKYDVVVREGIVEADPKGIYFAESTKTIKVGESYTPVVMGVATGKKVTPDTLKYGTNTSKEVIDIDDTKVIGTKEGVAYITAEYKAAGVKTNYVSSSMKIVVTAGEVIDNTTADTYKVTASSLNVRKGPGTSYAKAYQLKYGATVKVDSIANGWAKLSDGNYVSAQYLTKTTSAPAGDATTMYVTCRTLNVRSGAGTSYSKVGTLSRNAAVEVVSVSNGWAKLSNGNYVAYKYLSL